MDFVSFGDFWGEEPLQGARTQSTLGQSESETVTISGSEDGDGDCGAEGDAQSSPRRRKARMNEVDEATKLVSGLVKSHSSGAIILPRSSVDEHRIGNPSRLTGNVRR